MRLLCDRVGVLSFNPTGNVREMINICLKWKGSGYILHTRRWPYKYVKLYFLKLDALHLS